MMSAIDRGEWRPTASDLDFLVEAVAPEARDKGRIRQILEEDEDLRNSFIADDRTSRKTIADKEIFLKISPRLYFEILLRKTGKDLEGTSHTIERGGTRKVAVFDTRVVVDLLFRPGVLAYLADMLSSFTKVESYTLSLRETSGAWRKIRFNDMDIGSLIRLCDFAGEEHRLAFYKRIADVCLFLLGVFPEWVSFSRRHAASESRSPLLPGPIRWSVEEYAEEGRKFYKLASEHPGAKSLELSGVFRLFHENFHSAKKPLNFMAEHYIRHCRSELFPN